MKITQEVRDFAAKQNQGAESFLAATPIPPRNGEGDHAKHGGGAAPLGAEEAEAGMAHMSEKFRETGSELYMGAGGREHD
jgi:phosphomethylpyrimidine synthase